MGRQINYFVLPGEFPDLVAAVTKSESALWFQRLHSSQTIHRWDKQSVPARGDEEGWLVRAQDVPYFMEQELSWWEPRKRFIASAGGYGLEMGFPWFDGRRLGRCRIYFNTLPPLDPDVGRWANRVIAATRRFLVKVPEISAPCGPGTAEWLEKHHGRGTAGGLEVVID